LCHQDRGCWDCVLLGFCLESFNWVLRVDSGLNLGVDDEGSLESGGVGNAVNVVREERVASVAYNTDCRTKDKAWGTHKVFQYFCVYHSGLPFVRALFNWASCIEDHTLGTDRGYSNKEASFCRPLVGFCNVRRTEHLSLYRHRVLYACFWQVDEKDASA